MSTFFLFSNYGGGVGPDYYPQLYCIHVNHVTSVNGKRSL